MRPRPDRRAELARDVREGLGRGGQKRLPPTWFYDDLGSALYEAITLLPEYGLTRAGLRLLERHAGALAKELGPPLRVVELGSGSGRQTRLLLEALAAEAPVAYHPVDLSRAALERCRAELAPLSGVRLAPLEASYEEGLAAAAAQRAAGERLLVVFLGSTLGNFDPGEALSFLRAVRAALAAGDALLLGLDLVKSEERLVAAYDDALGVTAAFDRNLLARLNRELGADFDLAAFAHVARWTREPARVEMHLEARRACRVRVPGAGIAVELAAGETIWTESCHKFELCALPALARDAGFEPAREWVDAEWPFVQCLWAVR